jgi:cysteinyl-tRNA synthetase
MIRLPLVLALVALVAGAPAVQGAGQLAPVNDWVYVLQPGTAGADPAALAATDFDFVVMDPSADGTTPGEFPADTIAALRGSGKIVLAYLSIGEAEAYRSYFDPAWIDQPAPDPDAPAWLGPFNPDFPDNYKVRYWDPAWQALLFGAPGSAALDRILAQGFDGIYLDIIDAFDYWSIDQPERTRAQARTDMVVLVEALADYARGVRGPGAPRFLVFPQNGDTIVLDDGGQLDGLGACYLSAIDGIGVEDVFYNELTLQPADEIAFRTAVLALYTAAGRTVLSVDYVWNAASPGVPANAARYGDFVSRALAADFVPYAALSDRALDEILPVAAGAGVTVPQPRADTVLFADDFEAGNPALWSATVGVAAGRQRRELALECQLHRLPR